MKGNFCFSLRDLTGDVNTIASGYFKERKAKNVLMIRGSVVF